LLMTCFSEVTIKIIAGEVIKMYEVFTKSVITKISELYISCKTQFDVDNFNGNQHCIIHFLMMSFGNCP
jgi:hypothetical protein